MIHDSEDSVLPVSKGESHDQIHGYLLEGSSICRDRDSIKWGFLSMGDDFILLTDGTALDVISNPVVHCWPLIELFHFSDRFILAGMSGCHVIMSMCHDRS